MLPPKLIPDRLPVPTSEESIETIVNEKLDRQGNPQVLVKWIGKLRPTWEPRDAFVNKDTLVSWDIRQGRRLPKVKLTFNCDQNPQSSRLPVRWYQEGGIMLWVEPYKELLGVALVLPKAYSQRYLFAHCCTLSWSRFLFFSSILYSLYWKYEFTSNPYKNLYENPSRRAHIRAR